MTLMEKVQAEGALECALDDDQVGPEEFSVLVEASAWAIPDSIDYWRAMLCLKREYVTHAPTHEGGSP